MARGSGGFNRTLTVTAGDGRHARHSKSGNVEPASRPAYAQPAACHILNSLCLHHRALGLPKERCSYHSNQTAASFELTRRCFGGKRSVHKQATLSKQKNRRC